MSEKATTLDAELAQLLAALTPVFGEPRTVRDDGLTWRNKHGMHIDIWREGDGWAISDLAVIRYPSTVDDVITFALDPAMSKIVHRWHGHTKADSADRVARSPQGRCDCRSARKGASDDRRSNLEPR